MDTKYLKQVALTVLSTLLSVGVMLYIGYHLFYGLTQKMETEPALLSTVSHSVDTDVYIFRDERTLSSSGQGSLVPAVSDGERIGVGDVVSRRYDLSSPDVTAQIAVTDAQLAVIEEMKQHRISVRDTAAVENEICALMAELARADADGDCSAIASLRASLTAAMNRRTILTDASSDIGRAETELRAQRAALTSRLGSCRAEITAPISGYYYAEADGYESRFTAERALNMTPAEFEAMTEADPSAPATGGKIAESYIWYAACLVSESRTGEFQTGKTYDVRFHYNGGKVLSMRLERMVRDEAGVMLVFSSETLADDFTFTRSQRVTVLTGDVTGLRLPISALRISDGVAGVYILEGGVVHFRAVSILFEGEDYFIADPKAEGILPDGMQWLERNDTVITRGRGLFEGRVLA